MMLVPPPAPRCRPTLLPLGRKNPRTSTQLWADASTEEEEEVENNNSSSELADRPINPPCTSAHRFTTIESLELLQEIVRLQKELMNKDVEHKAIVDAKDEEIRRSTLMLDAQTKENQRLRAALKTAKRHSPQASGIQDIMKSMARTRIAINDATTASTAAGTSNTTTNNEPSSPNL